MKKPRVDNTIAFNQRTIKFDAIRVTRGTIKKSLRSHPNYPTFKSICDVSAGWKIELCPMKYRKDEIKDLKALYIAHFDVVGRQIALVSETIKSGIICYDSYIHKNKIEWEDNLPKISGEVILINTDKLVGEEDHIKKFQAGILGQSILLVSLSILVFFIRSIIQLVGTNNNLNLNELYRLSFAKIHGMAFSADLVLVGLEISIPRFYKLCNLNRFINFNTNINNRSSKIFIWVGWADVGLVYFMGSLLFLIQELNLQSNFLLASIASLALPYTIFSIYYHGILLKKWFPFCLGVQIILITEFILFFPHLREAELSFSSIAAYFLTFYTTGIVFLLLMMYFRERKFRELLKNKNLKFKSNPDIFWVLLFRQRQFQIPITDLNLVSGSLESDFFIVAFLSLHCSHCSITKIEDILQSKFIQGYRLCYFHIASMLLILYTTLIEMGRKQRHIVYFKECKMLILIQNMYFLKISVYQRLKIFIKKFVMQTNYFLKSVKSEGHRLSLFTATYLRIKMKSMMLFIFQKYLKQESGLWKVNGSIRSEPKALYLSMLRVGPSFNRKGVIWQR